LKTQSKVCGALFARLAPLHVDIVADVEMRGLREGHPDPHVKLAAKVMEDET